MRQSSVTVRIDSRAPLHPAFAGIGFQVEPAGMAASGDEGAQVFDKRWRELSPSFVRVDAPTLCGDALIACLQRLQASDAQLYLVRSGAPGDPRRLAVEVEELVRGAKIAGLRWLGFERPPEGLADALRRRRLALEVRTASGCRYLREAGPEDERFYPALAKELSVRAAAARERKETLWLDAFAGKPEARGGGRVARDGCAYFGTPLEPLFGLQLAETALAALQAGAGAVGYSTFADLPDETGIGVPRQWGLFRRSGPDRGTRAPYYAYGLLTRAFRGPTATLRAVSDEPWLRAAAARSAAEDWSLALVHRGAYPASVRIEIEGAPLTARFGKYVYDPARVPLHPFGDLPEPVARLAMAGGTMTDTVGPGTLTVYVRADERTLEPPERLEATVEAGGVRLDWRPGRSREIVYYRIFRGVGPDFVPGLPTQIGSTTATRFRDGAPLAGPPYYQVVAVDRRGSISPAAFTFRRPPTAPLP